MIEGVLVLNQLGHIRRERPDDAVAEQDAEESSDQRRSDFVADLLRRAAQRAHGHDHAQHRGDNAKPGQGIRHRAERRHGQGCAGMMDVHVEFHHLIDVEG